mmetsp:Transcript_38821/g.76975  ORF Transcript_38821/g.76975 Transcript_38821/m.76975 type:complete len:94 (+) Transcript_38821:393-674(+)
MIAGTCELQAQTLVLCLQSTKGRRTGGCIRVPEIIMKRMETDVALAQVVAGAVAVAAEAVALVITTSTMTGTLLEDAAEVQAGDTMTALVKAA